MKWMDLSPGNIIYQHGNRVIFIISIQVNKERGTTTMQGMMMERRRWTWRLESWEDRWGIAPWDDKDIWRGTK